MSYSPVHQALPSCARPLPDRSWPTQRQLVPVAGQPCNRHFVEEPLPSPSTRSHDRGRHLPHCQAKAGNAAPTCNPDQRAHVLVLMHDSFPSEEVTTSLVCGEHSHSTRSRLNMRRPVMKDVGNPRLRKNPDTSDLFLGVDQSAHFEGVKTTSPTTSFGCGWADISSSACVPTEQHFTHRTEPQARRTRYRSWMTPWMNLPKSPGER